MKLKTLSTFTLLSLLFVTTGCTTPVEIITQTIIRSPNEEGGLDANQEQDQVAQQSVEDVKTLMSNISKCTRFSYELTSTIPGSETHFIAYYTPHARYEKNDTYEASFGYAMTKEDEYMFRFHLNEEMTEVYPSVYEYSGFNGTIEKVVGLYDQFTLAHPWMLKDTLDTFSAINVGGNKYLLTDSESYSVFQYMTTYGSSISAFTTGVYIELISLENNIFNVIIDLGDYGSITSKFTPLTETPIDFVEEKIMNEGLVGVDYYDDTFDFFQNKMASNNYVLNGILTETGVGNQVVSAYTIHCTEDYFLFEYNEEAFPNDTKTYLDWGYAFIPAYKTVEYYDSTLDKFVSQTLSYESCYKFTIKENNEIYFSTFIGPVENGTLRFEQVETLPNKEDCEFNVYYIVPNQNGGKDAYELVTIDYDGNTELKFVSEWFDSISDFYLDDTAATFYLSGTALTHIGPNYFEKDLKQENLYYSTDTSIYTTIGNSLFGVGFQSTDTWLDYINKAFVELEKDDNNQIIEANIGLYVYSSISGSSYQNNKIYYNVSNFGNGNVDKIDDFLKGAIK